MLLKIADSDIKKIDEIINTFNKLLNYTVGGIEITDTDIMNKIRKGIPSKNVKDSLELKEKEKEISIKILIDHFLREAKVSY